MGIIRCPFLLNIQIITIWFTLSRPTKVVVNSIDQQVYAVRVSQDRGTNIMKALYIILLLCSTIILSACGGSGPEKSAETWFQAMATSDGTTALKLTCGTYKEGWTRVRRG